MHAAIVALAVLIPGECAECNKAGAGGAYVSGRPSPQAVNCPYYTPPVRWYCKPCAGCAGGTCLSCKSPYFGSAPYNYRVQFDYPWSQRPVYPFLPAAPYIDEPGEEIPIGPESMELGRARVNSVRR